MDVPQKVDRSTVTDLIFFDSIFFERKYPTVQKNIRKKLSGMKQENQALEEIIVAKNCEIADLKQSIKELQDIVSSTHVADLKNSLAAYNAKISELKKKNQELRNDLESVTKSNSSLNIKVQELTSELRNTVEKQRAVQLETAQSQLTLVKQKLFDSLNQNIELKNQLKLAQKCIQQEIGENVNLNVLATAGPTWRGRAQQILTLQLKINELRSQLENNKGDEVSWSDEVSDEPHVRRDQIYHKIEVDNLKSHITSLNSKIEELNQKISALKARNVNLVADCGKLREKCTQLESVIKGNEHSIMILKEKLDVQKYHYENRITESQKQIAETKKNYSNFEFQKEEMQIKIENLQEELVRKEKFIEELNLSIKRLEKDLKSITGDYLFECRDFKKEEFTGLIEALESEKANLLSLNRTTNQRLESERAKVLDLVDQISKQKVKICRLEAKIRDIEKINNSQAEKKKRTQRINKYSNCINNNPTMVPSFVFEQSSNEAPTMCYEQKNSTYEIEELKNKLQIYQEKIIILEDKLNYLNEEKQNDSEAFENVIKMSKSVLLDTIHGLKKKSSDNRY